jgi:hypothetical protein
LVLQADCGVVVEEGGYVYMEKVVSNEELYGKKKAEG